MLNFFAIIKLLVACLTYLLVVDDIWDIGETLVLSAWIFHHLGILNYYNSDSGDRLMWTLPVYRLEFSLAKPDPVGQSLVSAIPGLMFNPLFYFLYLYASVSLKTSETCWSRQDFWRNISKLVNKAAGKFPFNLTLTQG